MKIGIVGSRDYRNLENVDTLVNSIKHLEIEIVSGGARGVDRQAALVANKNSIPLTEYLPDWSLGKNAGLIRNNSIVSDSDFLIAFWDGNSTGTQHSVTLAKKKGIAGYIILDTPLTAKRIQDFLKMFYDKSKDYTGNAGQRLGESEKTRCSS